MKIVSELLIEGAFTMAQAALYVFIIEVVLRGSAIWYVMLLAAAIVYLVGILLGS